MNIVLANAVLGVVLVLVTFAMFFCLRLSCIHVTDQMKVEFLRSLLNQDAEWLDRQKFGALTTHLRWETIQM